jgi:MYXO-CTERM domain-containing protein
MRSHVARVCGYGLGLLSMVIAIEGHLLAGSVPVAPEIDGASISAGLGLVAACVLILRSRRRSK